MGTCQGNDSPPVTDLSHVTPRARPERPAQWVVMVFEQLDKDERQDVNGQSVDRTERVAVPLEEGDGEVKTVYLHSLSISQLQLHPHCARTFSETL